MINNYTLQNSDLVKQNGNTKSLFLQFNENLAFNFEIKKDMPATLFFALLERHIAYMKKVMEGEVDE